MAKVNRYRSGAKNPEREVLVIDDGEAVKAYVVDWGAMRVKTLKEVK